MYSASVNAYNQYRTTAVQTAKPEKLLLMLYDGLVLSLKMAQQALGKRDTSEAHQNLIKAQDIITELMSTLNMEYEISSRLFQLYDFWKRQLVQANTRKDVQIVGEVLSFVTELRDAWATVIKPALAEAVER